MCLGAPVWLTSACVRRTDSYLGLSSLCLCGQREVRQNRVMFKPIFDYIAVSGSLQDRVCEYVDHLHEHVVEPCAIRNAGYMTPLEPEYSIRIKDESIADYAFPNGSVWAAHGR